MNELDDLIRQKKELEQRIKELKNNASVCGQVKIDMEHYPTAKPDRYYLAVYYKPLGDGRPKWQTVFSANDRQKVVEVIPSIIANLQDLYDRNKGEPKTKGNPFGTVKWNP